MEFEGRREVCVCVCMSTCVSLRVWHRSNGQRSCRTVKLAAEEETAEEAAVGELKEENVMVQV